MKDVLEAPCIFCGYNGEGYWQAGRHDKRCPWFVIGGFGERELEIRRTLESVFVQRRIVRETLANVAASGGLGEKYIVQKVEGPTDPNAQYFVLRIDTDVHARRALRAYAWSVIEENELLASELIDMLVRTLHTPAGDADLRQIVKDVMASGR